MAKISIFCSLSGCTPESAQALMNASVPIDIDKHHESVVLNAIDAILSDDEREGQEDVTVIGAIGENGKLSSNSNGLDKEAALQIPDARLRVIPHCWMGDDWYYGFVAPPDPMTPYLVSRGTNIVVQSISLPILFRATGGRMTPQRLWRLAMWQGFSERRDHDVLDGIDYGEVTEGIDKYVKATPGIEDVMNLEELGDVETIKMAIIHKGKFWIWMRPDRFPCHNTNLIINPAHMEPPLNLPCATIEQLPYEIISQIVHDLPLRSLLAVVSTSRQLRSNFLYRAPDRDMLAHSWIVKTAPWYLPDQDLGSRTNDIVGWEYLKRCLGNGSMKNRRRIWRIAEQLEQMADVLGI